MCFPFAAINREKVTSDHLFNMHELSIHCRASCKYFLIIAIARVLTKCYWKQLFTHINKYNHNNNKKKALTFIQHRVELDAGSIAQNQSQIFVCVFPIRIKQAKVDNKSNWWRK